MPNYREIIAI